MSTSTKNDALLLCSGIFINNSDANQKHYIVYCFSCSSSTAVLIVDHSTQLQDSFAFDVSGETFRIIFSAGSSDVTSFLMTEARQHNTEIRLSVGKVADKVEQLASKV